LKLITEARGKGALIIYSVAVPNSVPGDILKELTPAAGEQVLPPLGPDKFINSDLEKTLKDRGIKTVIAMGTQAQTSVLHTGAAAIAAIEPSSLHPRGDKPGSKYRFRPAWESPAHRIIAPAADRAAHR